MHLVLNTVRYAQLILTVACLHSSSEHFDDLDADPSYQPEIDALVSKKGNVSVSSPFSSDNACISRY